MGPASNTYANINMLVPRSSSVIYSSLFTHRGRVRQNLSAFHGGSSNDPMALGDLELWLVNSHGNHFINPPGVVCQHCLPSQALGFPYGHCTAIIKHCPFFNCVSLSSASSTKSSADRAVS